MRRRKQRHTPDDTNQIAELTEETSQRNELEGGALVASKKGHLPMETGGTQIHEMDRQGEDLPKISELKGDIQRPVAELPTQIQNQESQLSKHNLAGNTAIDNVPDIPEMQQSPPSVLAQKPVTSTPSTVIPTESQSSAPWETSAAESAFSAKYPGPGAAKSKVEEDQELKEMEEEMARLKEAKDRLRRMQSLEVREKELRKGIEARRKGGGGPSGEGGSAMVYE